MSYSRWSTSCWYIYWSGGPDLTRDNQTLELWLTNDNRHTVRYTDLNTPEKREAVWQRIRGTVTDPGELAVYDAERGTFDEAVAEWLRDVDEVCRDSPQVPAADGR